MSEKTEQKAKNTPNKTTNNGALKAVTNGPTEANGNITLEKKVKSSANSHKSEHEVTGYLAKKLGSPIIRVLSILTGFFLISGLFTLIGRCLLVFKRKATLRVEGKTMILKEQWCIMGKSFRNNQTIAQLTDVSAIRFESRQRYVYLLVGFGCLAVGTWVGVQYLLDSFRAGFSELALVGAGIVAAGILIDLLLYFFMPAGKAQSRLLLTMGPWKIRLAGVDAEQAEQLVSQVQSIWKKAPAAQGSKTKKTKGA